MPLVIRADTYCVLRAGHSTKHLKGLIKALFYFILMTFLQDKSIATPLLHRDNKVHQVTSGKSELWWQNLFYLLCCTESPLNFQAAHDVVFQERYREKEIVTELFWDLQYTNTLGVLCPLRSHAFLEWIHWKRAGSHRPSRLVRRFGLCGWCRA